MKFQHFQKKSQKFRSIKNTQFKFESNLQVGNMFMYNLKSQ